MARGDPLRDRVAQAIGALQKVSAQPLPANVVREIEGWFEECRRVSLGAALLLRCPDPHTAARVRAAAGNAVKPISDTVLELIDPSARTRLVRKLHTLGIFIEAARPG